jgi:hypothetical protein
MGTIRKETAGATYKRTSSNKRRGEESMLCSHVKKLKSADGTRKGTLLSMFSEISIVCFWQPEVPTLEELTEAPLPEDQVVTLYTLLKETNLHKWSYAPIAPYTVGRRFLHSPRPWVMPTRLSVKEFVL